MREFYFLKASLAVGAGSWENALALLSLRGAGAK